MTTPVLESEARRVIESALAPYVSELGIVDLGVRVKDLAAAIPREGTACALVDAVVWSADEVTQAIKRGKVESGEHMCRRLRANFAKAVRGEIGRLVPDGYALPARPPPPRTAPPRRLLTPAQIREQGKVVERYLREGFPPPPDFPRHPGAMHRTRPEDHDPDGYSRDPERGDPEPVGWTVEDVVQAFEELKTDVGEKAPERGRQAG